MLNPVVANRRIIYKWKMHQITRTKSCVRWLKKIGFGCEFLKKYLIIFAVANSWADFNRYKYIYRIFITKIANLDLYA